MSMYTLDNLSILVVEDNPHVLKMIAQILNNFGVMDVRKATNGDDAFVEFSYAPPDLVITDWVMDGMDGLELIKKIRTDEQSPAPMVPIIMVTGHSERYRIVEARDSGINEFVAKPFSPKAIYDRIVAIIDRPRKFIRGNNYVGPDRRRQDKHFTGDERRGTSSDETEEMSPEGPAQEEAAA